MIKTNMIYFTHLCTQLKKPKQTSKKKKLKLNALIDKIDLLSGRVPGL